MGGGKEYMENFGEETSWKTDTSNTENKTEERY
jgi:hypothetical protein